MPNMEPQDLPIQPAVPIKVTPGDCSHGSCVDVVDNADGTFAVRSTRRPEMTPVIFDADEIVKFFDEVMAGDWNAILASARVRLAERSPVDWV